MQKRDISNVRCRFCRLTKFETPPKEPTTELEPTTSKYMLILNTQEESYHAEADTTAYKTWRNLHNEFTRSLLSFNKRR